MSYRAVCISRAVAAGGEQAGRLVAERLGFHYVDEEVITLASEKAGVDPAVVAEAEHYTSPLTRLMDALVRPPLKTENYLARENSTEYYTPEAPPPIAPPPQEELRRLIQETVLEIARRGRAVIVAHAASMALAGQKDILRVLVTAPPKVRAHRLWLAARLLSEEEYARAVAESDRERLHYLERFFDVKEELPAHYDLVINTEALRIHQAVDAIVATATG